MRCSTYPRRQMTTGTIGYRWPPRCGPMMHQPTRSARTGSRGLSGDGSRHGVDRESPGSPARSAEWTAIWSWAGVRAREEVHWYIQTLRCGVGPVPRQGPQGGGTYPTYQSCSWRCLRKSLISIRRKENLKHGDKLGIVWGGGRMLRPHRDARNVGRACCNDEAEHKDGYVLLAAVSAALLNIKRIPPMAAARVSVWGL